MEKTKWSVSLDISDGGLIQPVLTGICLSIQKIKKSCTDSWIYRMISFSLWQRPCRVDHVGLPWDPALGFRHREWKISVLEMMSILWVGIYQVHDIMIVVEEWRRKWIRVVIKHTWQAEDQARENRKFYFKFHSVDKFTILMLICTIKSWFSC
mgnify:CR=1 FL=1